MSVSSSADETKNDKLAVSVVREEAAAEDGTDDESSVGGSSGSGSRSGSGSVSGGMPLLHYKRLFGSSLPRRDDAVSTPITAMLMGKVILNAHTTHPKPDEPEENRSSHTTTNNNNASHHSANTTTATNSTASLNHPVEGQEIPVQQWQNKPVSIAVVGFQDGSVRLMDVCTGTSILGDPTVVWYPTDDHHHNTNTAQKAIVAVSLDASGTAIAAIDESGNCTVWTVKYSLQYRSAQPQQQPQPPQRPPSPPPLRPGNVLTKLFWKKETPPPTTRTMVTAADVVPGAAVELVPTLVLADVKVTRTTYPRKDFGTPTCLCLDPAYKNKLIVAFDGGKIVLSSRNWMRLDHAVLPYTGPLRDKDWKGIEAVTWRGSLLAFADCSGVKLYDLATLKPVAHVDRPTGARPSLYPGTTTVQAHICFETSRSLLVAWGDCLMALTVTDFMEHPRSTATAAVPDAPAAGTPVPPTRKRTVACTMAWGLDYVAMGVVPLDARHVAVLGLVPDSTEVDLQVIDRTNGFVVHSDLLALAQPKLIGKQSKTAGTLYNGRTNYMLLSSFAVPRQEDIVELKDEKGIDGDANLVAAIVSSVGGAKLEFVDSHLKWDLSMVSFNDDHDTEVNGGAVSGDTDSVDSDDYGFVLRNAESPGIAESAELVSPPLLLVASSSDVAVGRMRDVDDAIQFALEHKKMALALRRALPRVRQLRRYTVNDLINSYFRSVLRLTATDDKEKAQHLSLRRVKLAAKALPVLLGGNVDLWETWVSELERIPGALFVVKNFLPVRDPKLPKPLYARVLRMMLEEVEDMRRSTDSDAMGRLLLEAEGHFLNTLLAWGTTRTLKEHIKLFENQSRLDVSFDAMVRRTTESLNHRYEQTAVGYLDLSSGRSSAAIGLERKPSDGMHTHDATDSLYNIDDLIAYFVQKIAVLKLNTSTTSLSVANGIDSTSDRGSRVILEALAKLYMMKACYDEALKCFLVLGALHSSQPLEEIEDEALAMVNNDDNVDFERSRSPHSFVLNLIENYHLHQSLLETNFLPRDVNCSPICALLQLVGLQLMGDFLIENCIAPQQKTKAPSSSSFSYDVPGPPSIKTRGERRGTLPLDLVANELSGSPKLFHWYLHMVFVRKPEVYVKFPTTANPPPVITTLHKKHLDLYIKYAGVNRDSARALAGIEAYRVAEKSTSLLSFLKVILQLGAIGPAEVGKMLEIERRGGAGVSRTFALELAYIMENYGDDSESDAQLILELYLKGAQSLMLAVSFAQRAKAHSANLWGTLIDHCLSRSAGEQSDATSVSGTLFGSLLEAAALSGADLASLVKQIPPGMQVEGLRPRLVAAVADYRLKVQLHSTSAEIAMDEKALLFQEYRQRSRRGMRYEGSNDASLDSLDTAAVVESKIAVHVVNTSDAPEVSLLKSRTRHRASRNLHSLSIAIR